MGKGEIARYEQFLLFCFQKTCTADTKKPGLVWERDIESLPIRQASLRRPDISETDPDLNFFVFIRDILIRKIKVKVGCAIRLSAQLQGDSTSLHI